MSRRRLLCYYTEWSRYGRKFTTKDIDTQYITTILYAFLNVDAQGNLKVFDPWSTLQIGQDWSNPNSGNEIWGNMRELRTLKEKHPHLEILWSVGGWTLSTHINKVLSTAEGRTKLVNESLRILREYPFLDGLDWDIEWIGAKGHDNYFDPVNDGPNFTKFLQQLTRAMPSDKLITMAGPADTKKIEKLEVSKIAGILDWCGIMSYDFEGSWSDKVGHHANLYGDMNEYSVDTAVRKYVELGMPVEKLIMGIPNYSREFANVEAGPNEIPIGKPFRGTPQGEFEAGTNDYRTIVDKLESNSNYKRMFDGQKVAHYLWNPTERIVVSYDNPEMVAKKTEYVKNNGLGGVMFWSVAGDHKRNDKSNIQRAYHELNIDTSTPVDPQPPRPVTPPPVDPPRPPTPPVNPPSGGDCECKCVLKIDKEVKSVKFNGKGKYTKNLGVCEFEGELEVEYM